MTWPEELQVKLHFILGFLELFYLKNVILENLFDRVRHFMNLQNAFLLKSVKKVCQKSSNIENLVEFRIYFSTLSLSSFQRSNEHKTDIKGDPWNSDKSSLSVSSLNF